MVFAQILKKISPKLKAITYRLNGHYTVFNHEDLYQEAVLHLWLSFQEGKLQDKTESYILQGCYFHLKNHIRKVKSKTNLISLNELISQEENGWEEILPVKDQRDYLDYLDSKIFVEKMQNNGLSKREKAILPLCLEGLTTREIGKRLGISHVMVLKLKTQIRDKYQNIFQELSNN
ncbi:MAG: sigma-70 family RNA polymerase sigma factor [Candidatus Omnitrophica bacterium]|nr:sigma-70 family RNA polymerase sigma factor [Candidatus Omnitrophota bacterium]